MNEFYLCRACSLSSKILTGICRNCGACSWNIVKERLTEMPWYSLAAKVRIMNRMARAQSRPDLLTNPLDGRDMMAASRNERAPRATQGQTAAR
jgi:predicted ATP-dependent serine protease